jgi:hypothetical protein
MLRLSGTIAGNKLANGVPESYMEYVPHDNEFTSSHSISRASAGGRFRRP